MPPRCRGCGQAFRPRPQNPHQTYCSQPACQRAWQRDWQRRQRASDPDYRANDQAARNARRRAAGVIANEDAWTPESDLAASTYHVEPWSGADCECGRVNAGKLFLLSPVETSSGA